MDQRSGDHQAATAIRRFFLATASGGVLLAATVAASAQNAPTINVYAGQFGFTPNSTATSNTCSTPITLRGSAAVTAQLGANTGDGCAIAKILLSKPVSTQFDTFGQFYIADQGNYTSNTSPTVTSCVSSGGDAATYTTPTTACPTAVKPGPGYIGEVRVLYNGTNTALGPALVASVNASGVLSSPTAGNVYNIIGGGPNTVASGGGQAYGITMTPSAMAVDASGNVFTQNSGYLRLTFVTGTQTTSYMEADGGVTSNSPTAGAAPLKGDQYVINNSTTTGYSGDGGFAYVAKMNGAKGMALDASGNLYVADSGNNVIREINISGATTDAAGNATQLGYITTVVGGAGAGCIAGTKASCTSEEAGDGGAARSANLSGPFDLTFDSNGNLYIADYGTATGRVRVVYLGTQPPPGYYATVSSGCNSTASTATTGILATCGDIYTYAGGGTSSSGSATSVKLLSASGLGFDSNGNLFIGDTAASEIWEVKASTQTAAVVAGGGSSSTATSCSGSVDSIGDGCVGTSATIGASTSSAPIGHISGDSSGNVYFADPVNNLIREIKPFIQGTGSNVITFTAPTTPITYGASSITLGATASSGLAVSYTITGPTSLSGSTLSFTGAGTVTITASQAGNTTYAAAAPVQQSIVVQQANLNIGVVGSPSRYYGQPNPTFTYTLGTFVNGDTQATATTGAPTLTTAAVPKSAAGPYTITVGINTLSAANYTFTPVNGSLTVTGGAAQAILFAPLTNFTHGTSVPLIAVASSGLPVVFTVTSGNASIANGSSTMAVTGTGSVTITASQPGNGNFTAATSVSQTFTAQ